MDNLRKKGLDQVIREVTDRGTPFLGFVSGCSFCLSGVMRRLEWTDSGSWKARFFESG